MESEPISKEINQIPLDYIFAKFKLRNTDSRNTILKVFFTNNYALSQLDIEHTIGNSYDRTTIFRTLKTFLKKEIIHKVLDEGGGSRYALIRLFNKGIKYYNDHVHFKCNKCGLINCIPDLGIPQIELPEGYKIQKSSLLFQGICNNCSIVGFRHKESKTKK